MRSGAQPLDWGVGRVTGTPQGDMGPCAALVTPVYILNSPENMTTSAFGVSEPERRQVVGDRLSLVWEQLLRATCDGPA